ncbi:hypothetical protein [Rubritalea tangerina]|uniref:hypothetical protein n=1 Tax=Rubritalea tangerina TaxID=430798 RepID=UPI00361EBC1A
MTSSPHCSRSSKFSFIGQHRQHHPSPNAQQAPFLRPTPTPSLIPHNTLNLKHFVTKYSPSSFI